MTANENFFPKKFEYDFAVHFRHFQRYVKAIELLGKTGEDETWLDCACGSGYGTQLLSGFTKQVVGYDINKEAIIYALNNYGNVSCTFVDNKDLLNNRVFNVIFSIETIEHMTRDKAVPFLKFLGGLLDRDGILLITTPLVQKSNPNPSNVYHKYEYSKEEFLAVLAQGGFTVQDTFAELVTFTDGETKSQAFFKCIQVAL